MLGAHDGHSRSCRLRALGSLLFNFLRAHNYAALWKLVSYTDYYRASDISRKKSKILRDFRGKFTEKSADFAGFSREKSLNSRKIGRFRGRKVKICRKIGRFRGILAEKSQILKDFLGQIIRKIGRFHGKFRGGNFAKKQSVKNSWFRRILFGKFC